MKTKTLYRWSGPSIGVALPLEVAQDEPRNPPKQPRCVDCGLGISERWLMAVPGAVLCAQCDWHVHDARLQRIGGSVASGEGLWGRFRRAA